MVARAHKVIDFKQTMSQQCLTLLIPPRGMCVWDHRAPKPWEKWRIAKSQSIRLTSVSKSHSCLPTKPPYTPGALFSSLQNVSLLYFVEVQLSWGWQCQVGQEFERHFTGKETPIRLWFQTRRGISTAPAPKGMMNIERKMNWVSSQQVSPACISITAF